MRDLTDKLVWITGAGTGIGAAGAKALAAAGCRLILSGRRRDPLEAVAAEIGAQATIMPLDVADRAAVETAGREIQAIHGTVDVLVNNAGINVPKRHWPDVSPEDWEQVIQIDVNGVYYCTQAVLPAMRDRGEGLIVNISSWAGARVSFLTGPAYTAAKHAVNAMTGRECNKRVARGEIRRATYMDEGGAVESLLRNPPLDSEARSGGLECRDVLLGLQADLVAASTALHPLGQRHREGMGRRHRLHGGPGLGVLAGRELFQAIGVAGAADVRRRQADLCHVVRARVAAAVAELALDAVLGVEAGLPVGDDPGGHVPVAVDAAPLLAESRPSESSRETQQSDGDDEAQQSAHGSSFRRPGAARSSPPARSAFSGT